jgi:predicted protein tyrosine phosphatase
MAEDGGAVRAVSEGGAGVRAPFGITVCGLPELGQHCRAGVTHLLSILDPDFPLPEAFGEYGEHRRLELRFHDVIEEGIPGMRPPEAADVAQVLAFGHDLEAEGNGRGHLLVHCHAGVSRSTAAMALIIAQALPTAAAAAVLGEVVRIRPQAWPNLRLLEMGDALLRRGGTLVEAAGAVYRRQMATRPTLAAEMRAGGRGREVAIAESAGASLDNRWSGLH